MGGRRLWVGPAIVAVIGTCAFILLMPIEESKEESRRYWLKAQAKFRQKVSGHYVMYRNGKTFTPEE